MTDYYNPRAYFSAWYVTTFEGKHVTESKLRRALQRCPAWVQGLGWKYTKTYYKKPYLASGPITDESLIRRDNPNGVLCKTGKLTYSHYDKPFFFCLEETTDNTLFKSNNPEAREPIPPSKAELMQYVEAKTQERLTHLEVIKKRQAKANIKTIQTATAVIDGQGFRILTPDDRKELIQKQFAKVKEWGPLLRDEATDFINEYERTQVEENAINEANIKAVIEAFKPLVAFNLKYMRYAELKGYFTIPQDARNGEALHNAITTVIGRLIRWEIHQGRELAFKVLEETNDHRTAEQVKPYLLGEA